MESGELIHIDYGIALDKGRFLPVPEIVPFRMTPDLVAGLGCFGDALFDHSGHGWFRSVGEKVLQTYRVNAPLVVAALDVFLNDPLYHWTTATNLNLIDREIRKRLGVAKLPFTTGPVSDRNAMARWTILRIQKKIRGVVVDLDHPEEPGAPEMPVSTVFQRLMHLASADERLAQMFVGWSPWV